MKHTIFPIYGDEVESKDFAPEIIKIVKETIQKEKVKQIDNKHWNGFLFREIPVQGWKIHISCTLDNYYEILLKVSSYCFQNKIGYKFLKNLKLIKESISKSAARESSGKFITIYPLDELNFKEIINDLYEILKGYNGPYILSDRRYKDSKVLFYRYGRLKFNEDEPYENRFYVYDELGNKYIDSREPIFQLPPFIKDPFFNEANETDNNLLNGKYEVIKAIHISNSGGVYLANDITQNKTVILKEARPFLVGNESKDSIYLRKRECYFLSILNDLNVSPKIYESFYEWEHYFIAVEYIEGYGLHEHIGKHGTAIFFDKEVSSILFENNIKIIKSLMEKIKTVHELGIYINDLSSQNVIIKDSEAYFIDLEFAQYTLETGSIIPYSPGYYDVKTDFITPRERDYVSLGYIIMNMFVPSNYLAAIDKNAALRVFKSFNQKYNIPENIVYITEELLTNHENIDLGYLLNILDEKNYKISVIENEISIIQSRLISEFKKNFGKNPIFETSNLNLELTSNLMKGDTGVILNIYEIMDSSHREEFINKYILPLINSKSARNPSLWYGLSGLIIAMLRLGEDTIAINFAEKIIKEELLKETKSLYLSDGMAGIGLAFLMLYQKVKNEKYLNIVLSIGNYLLDSQDEKGYWIDENSNIIVGIKEGNLGISLLLLQIYTIDRDRKYLDAVRKSLQYLSGNLEIINGALIISKEINNGNVKTPYLSDGLAGLIIVIKKYLEIDDNKELNNILIKIVETCKCEFSTNVSLFNGLSGMGVALLEAYEFYKNEDILIAAYNIFKSITLYKVEVNGVHYYPNSNIIQVSSDLESGEAGILYFFNKLVYNIKASNKSKITI